MTTPTPGPDRSWVAALVLQPGSRLRGRLAVGLARLSRLLTQARLSRGRRRRLLSGAVGLAAALALGAGLLVAQPNALAAGIVVDGVTCTLGNAIASANTDSAVGGCSAGAGDDIITLTADVLLTSAHGAILDELTGLPMISTPLTIEGNGHTIQRDAAADPFRLMVINNATVTFNNLTLTGGSGNYGGAFYSNRGIITLTNVTISGNEAVLSGGAFHQNRGRITVTGSTLSGNSGPVGGAIYTYRGGLTIGDSIISGNVAEDGSGGGLYIAYQSTVDISDTTVSGNTAGLGGGMHLTESTVTVTDSLISGNTAETGAGFYVYAGTVALTTTTIQNNEAVYGGGGFYGYESGLSITRSTISGNSAAYGGGFYHSGIAFEPLTVANSTISGNSAIYGGGLVNSGNAELVNVTITQNSAVESGGGVWNIDDILTVGSSLISGNSAPVGAEISAEGGLVSSNGGNVLSNGGQTTAAALYYFSPGTDDFDASADAANVALSAILSPLATQNGGPTKTHALILDSPAIDWSASDLCAFPPVSGVDQRGQPRPVNGDAQPSATECDAGAFEFDPAAPTVTPTPSPSATPSITPTPSPTPTGTLMTPTPTATEATATPSPSATPTASATAPSATPSPSPTPSPSATPPTPAPSPSATAPTPTHRLLLPIILDEP